MADTNRIELDGQQQRTAVIAFGGNALLRPQDHGTQEEQFTLSWKATRWLVEGGTLVEVGGWVRLLVAYDLVVVAVSVLTFGYVVEE